MQNTKKNKSGPTRACFQDGFTLLEILLVVGIFAILAGIVIVAINPGRQLAYARNTERVSDLKQINNALQQYYIDHSSYPASLTTTLTEICNTGASTSVSSGYCTGKINLSVLVPTYITAIPTDPQIASNDSTTNTYYQVIKYASSGKIGLRSESAEQSQTITINVPADPCSGKSIGQACTGTTALYAGIYNGSKYMVPAADRAQIAWAGTYEETFATSLTDGNANTANLAARGSGYVAAYYCDGLTEGEYSDWFLPARYELSMLYDNRSALGMNGISYWTSTENGPYNALWKRFWDGQDSINDKIFSKHDVRCARKY
jgi:prepilin-type N-terminal cleavage/methylation domain-containing protein